MVKGCAVSEAFPNRGFRFEKSSTNRVERKLAGRAFQSRTRQRAKTAGDRRKRNERHFACQLKKRGGSRFRRGMSLLAKVLGADKMNGKASRSWTAPIQRAQHGANPKVEFTARFHERRPKSPDVPCEAFRSFGVVHENGSFSGRRTRKFANEEVGQRAAWCE